MNTFKELQIKLASEEARLQNLQTERANLLSQEETARTALVEGQGDVASLSSASASRAALEGVIVELEARIASTQADIATEEARIEREEKLDTLAARAAKVTDAKNALVEAQQAFAQAYQERLDQMLVALDSFIEQRDEFRREATTANLPSGFTSSLEARGVDISGIAAVFAEGYFPVLPKEAWNYKPLAFPDHPMSQVIVDLLVRELVLRTESTREEMQKARLKRFSRVLGGASAGGPASRDNLDFSGRVPDIIQPLRGGK